MSERCKVRPTLAASMLQHLRPFVKLKLGFAAKVGMLLCGAAAAVDVTRQCMRLDVCSLAAVICWSERGGRSHDAAGRPAKYHYALV